MINLTSTCKICNQGNFREVLQFPKAFFSDGSVMQERLIKEECIDCGTIRTKLDTSLEKFYENEYTPSRNVDTVAVSNNVELTRSTFIYNWLMQLMQGYNIDTIESIMEIGCGQGYLLDKFSIDNKYGVEPSLIASNTAKKVANVRNIGFDSIDDSEAYDFILSYCVVEHIENPNDFLEKSFNILCDNGVMAIALPIQNKFNYDLFFADHIHHFDNENFIKLLNKNGFEVLNYELGRDSYSNIGFYFCKKQIVKQEVTFNYYKNKNLDNVHTVLDNIGRIIEKNANKKLYAFGFGEISKTIIPYTRLDEYIISYIDDFNYDSKVISSNEAKSIFRKDKEIDLILLVNPMHIEKIKKLFDEFNNINFINIFETIDMS